MSPALFFFLKITLASLGLLWFHTNFKIIYFTCVKNVIGILIRIAMNLYIFSGRIDILTIFLKSMSMNFFYLPMSSVYFISVLFTYVFSLFHQCTDLSSPWLNLLLGTLFFLCSCKWFFLFFFLTFSFFAFFRATPVAYGSSQARGRIRAVAASLHHSHSNVGSEHWDLKPTP